MEEKVTVPEARATLKYARISARKVKIVIDLIRGKSVDEALAILKYLISSCSEDSSADKSFIKFSFFIFGKSSLLKCGTN